MTKAEEVNESKEIKNDEEKLIDSAMNYPGMKEKFNEEVEKASKEQTHRALLTNKIMDYDNETLERELPIFKKVSSKKYETIIKKRDEVLSDIDNCSIETIEEVNKNLEIALAVEENVRKNQQLDIEQRAKAVPIMDTEGSSNVIRHRPFGYAECRNMRDVKDPTCIEASLAWTGELNEFRRKKPHIEREVLNEII